MSDLGTLQKEHRGAPTKHFVAAAMGWLFVLVAIYRVTQMAPVAPAKAALMLTISGALAMAFTALAIHVHRARLWVHENGVVYERGGKQTLVRYADIATVTPRGSHDNPALLIISLKTGERVELPGIFEGWEHVARTIENAA